MAQALTDEEVLRLAEEQDIVAACDLLEKHGIEEDVDTIEEAQCKLWELLAERQESASSIQTATHSTTGVLEDVLQSHKTAQAEFLRVLQDTHIYLESFPEELTAYLGEVCPGYADTLASINTALTQGEDSVLLIAGETSSGKSTVLNLLLGRFNNDFLPVDHLSSTSVLCELRYGTQKKLIAHYKAADVPPETVMLPPDHPGEVIAKYVHQQGDREASEFPYNRVEIHWPFDWLPEGVCLMDSPGIGENQELTRMVTETLKHVFGVIYVVNTSNAGSISGDRLDVLLRAQNEAWKDVQSGSFTQSSVFFICNKWDAIRREKARVKKHIGRELAIRGFKEDQAFFISARDAQLQLKAGYLSANSDLSVLMKGIQKIVPAQLKLKLSQHHNSIKIILGRIEQILIAFNTKYTKEKLEAIARGREKVAELQAKVSSLELESKEQLEKKYKHAVEKLKGYLTSAPVRDRISTWQKADCPHDFKGHFIDDLRRAMIKRIVKRLQQTVQEWEVSTHTFENIYKEIDEFFTAEYKVIWKQATKIEMEIFGQSYAPGLPEPEPEQELSVGGKIAIGLTFPLWIPLTIALTLIATPFVIGWLIYEVVTVKRTLTNIESEMAGMSKGVLNWFASTEEIQKALQPVKAQIQVLLKKHVHAIGEHLQSQQLLLKRQEGLSMVQTLAMSVNVTTLALKQQELYGDLQMVFLEHIKVYDVKISDLKLQANIGEGAFANVFKAKWQGKQVAVKVMKSMLDLQSAVEFAKEEDNLRRLQNPHVVKLYGCCYEKTDRGVKIGLMMEYCDRTLTEVIQPPTSPAHFPKSSRQQKEAVERATGLAVQLAEGLAAVHDVGHVHRDLKPDNVLIDSQGNVKIADLGLAKDKADIRGTVCGTLIYMAPEVMQGQRYSEKADMFAYGMIVWELWYGESAQKQAIANPSGFLTRFVRDPYLAGRARPDSLYDRVLRSCLQMDPEQRPAAAACARALQGDAAAVPSIKPGEAGAGSVRCKVQ